MKGFLAYMDIPFDVKVKVPKTLPDYVETSDIDQIVQWIKSKHSHKNSITRDLTLLETAKRTGMRRSELANLKVKDIFLDKNRLYVRGGKGDKDRVIPIHPQLKISLSQLLHGKAEHERVFGLKSRSLGNKFRNWSNQVGVDLHTHSFRHHFATKLVERGANIRAVQELLGHTNLNTTQVYLSVTGKHLEEAIGLLD
jgi:integrase/recombinase XerD